MCCLAEGSTRLKEHRSVVFWNTGKGLSASSMSFPPQGYFGDTRIVHDIAAMDIDGDGDNDPLLLSSESTPADAYWTSVLDNKYATLAEVLVGFSESHENQVGLIGVMSGGFGYTPYP
jgi:hypothetical protein